MIKIGIIGDFLRTANIISEILKNKTQKVKIINYSNYFNSPKLNTEYLIIGITTPYISSDCINKLNLNVLIINKKSFVNTLNTPNIVLQKNGILILNTDNENHINIFNKNEIKLITVGYNNKATVTISSIITSVYQTIQFCLQRSIYTIYNNLIIEQEFSITTKNNDIKAILSAITTILILGFDIEFIKSIQI